MGYGNKTFSKELIYSSGKDSHPSSIVADYLNNDHRLDLVVANKDTNQIGIFFGFNSATFHDPFINLMIDDQSPWKMVVNDLNNDHYLDIAVIFLSNTSFGILLGHANGSFSNLITYPTESDFDLWGIAAKDINNDMNIDMIIANGRFNGSIGVFLGYGNGTFGDLFLFSTNGYWGSLWISVGDFNRDNHLDIATVNSNANKIGILFGYGNGTFDKIIKGYSTGVGSNPTCIDVNDLNNDNILDIAVTNFGTNEIVVLFGLGDGTFLLGKPYSTGLRSAPYGLAIVDFNNDSRLDLVVANRKSKKIRIFLGYDIEPFGSMLIPRNEFWLQPHSVAIGDFDHDNRSDIVVANYGSDNVGILLEFDGSEFNTVRNYSTGTGSAPYSIALAHLNNDTDLDIVVVNSESDNILFLFGHGDGTFEKGYTYSTGTRSRPYSISINDLNNDHLLDIAIVNSGTSYILLLYGYGNGTFGNEISYYLGYGYHLYSIATKDLNNDHLIDIVIACYDTDHVEVFMQMCLV